MFILLGVAALLVLFLIVAATRPSAYRVERKLEIAAERVFGVLNDLRQFARIYFLFGEPLEKDPNLKKTVEGAAGVGQSLAWNGRDAGEGKLAIEESVAGQKVGLKLEFVKPMASKATLALTLVGTATSTVVTWSMDGNHNFIGKAFGVVMNMDKMLGGDVEKALAQLKLAAEGKRG